MEESESWIERIRAVRIAPETLKLWVLITFSKSIPSVYKRALKKRLIHKREPGSLSQAKYLVSHLTYLDAYDIFTSSILCVHYRNWLSLEILTRAQLENLFLTQYLCYHPERIKEVFSGRAYEDAKAYIRKQKDSAIKRLMKYHGRYYSQKAHPSQKRFVEDIEFYIPLVPKGKVVDPRLLNHTEFNKLRGQEQKKLLKEFFRAANPLPGVTVVPHKEISKDALQQKSQEILLYFDRVTKDLNELEEICPDYEMQKEEWKHVIRKHRKDLFDSKHSLF